MDRTITEYYTASHAVPLVFAPNMGLIFLKDNSKVYQVQSIHFRSMISTGLDHIIEKNGDFTVTHLTPPNYGMKLSLVHASGFVLFNIFVLEMEWWKSFFKVQRTLKFISWKRRGSRVKLLKEFQESDRAKNMPSDITSRIIHAYLEPPPRQIGTRGVRIVETNSFKIQKTNLHANSN